MKVNPDAPRDLIVGIVKQACDDWKALNYGEYRECRFAGSTVRRKEVLMFLRSDVFELMCNFVLDTPIAVIREKLRVPMEDENDQPKPC